MTLKRRVIVVYFDFHKSQDINDFENQLRSLIQQKKLPSIVSLKLMVDYRNLRQIGIQDLPIPIVIIGDELMDKKD